MLDRVLCFAWGRLPTDNWRLDNPYAAWVELLIQAACARPWHEQSVVAQSPRGMGDLVHESRLKRRRRGRLSGTKHVR